MSELTPELSKVFHDAVEKAARKIHDEVMALRLAPRNAESQIVARIEWDCEGLPPVGVSCEYFDGGEWMQCEVVAHRENGAVVLSTDYEAAYVPPQDLRPIRDDDQIEAEARKKQLSSLASLIMQESRAADVEMPEGAATHVASVLLMDGYRKP